MAAEHKWEIGVRAGAYFPSLTRVFIGDDIGLSYENDHLGMQFFAYSSHIDAQTDPVDVSRRLFSLQLLLNGALRLDWATVSREPVVFTNFAQIPLGASFEVSPDQFEPNPFQAVFTPAMPAFPNSPEKADRFFASLLLHLASYSEELRTLLALVGLIRTYSMEDRILAWSTLYKIHDCVRTYASQTGHKWEAFVNAADVNRFTAAVNNMSVLGLFARHGAANNPKPKNVLSDLGDACDLTLKYARRFCVAFVNTKYPEFSLSSDLPPTSAWEREIKAEDLFD